MHSHKRIHSSRPKHTYNEMLLTLIPRLPRTLDHSTVCWGYSEDQSHPNANHNSPCSLARNNLGPEGVRHLGPFLKGNTSLTML